MIGAGQYSKLSLFNFSKPSFLFALFTAFVLAGCGGGGGSQDETPTTPESKVFSVQVPDAILASGLDLNAGTLTATISVNGGTPQAMTISGDNLTASATLNDIPTGDSEFTIVFTYDSSPVGPLDVASATKTINVTTGSNTLSFAASDFVTDIFDADGDGVSNIVELDETSVSSPVVALCELGTAVLGSCELGS